MSNEKRVGTGDAPTSTTPTTSTGSAWPIVLAGAGLLLGLGIVVDMLGRSHKESAEDEARRFFPGPRTQTRVGGRGTRALAYQANAARCVFRELRHHYGTDEAARITRGALQSERSWLTALSHRGAPVQEGCDLLRRHVPAVYVAR